MDAALPQVEGYAAMCDGHECCLHDDVFGFRELWRACVAAGHVYYEDYYWLDKRY